MMGTIDTMNKTMDSVKLITDETQYVVGEVKGFVGGIKTKCEDLETVLVDDVKSVIGKSINQLARYFQRNIVPLFDSFLNSFLYFLSNICRSNKRNP